MRKRTVRRARGEAGQCSAMGGAGRLGRSPPALLLWLALNFACILSLHLGWKAAVLVPGMGMLHACAPKCLFDLAKQSTGTNMIVVNLFRWAWTYGEEEKLFEQKTIWANAFKVHLNVFRLEISVVRRQDNEPFWNLSLVKWEKYLQIQWHGRYISPWDLAVFLSICYRAVWVITEVQMVILVVIGFCGHTCSVK